MRLGGGRSHATWPMPLAHCHLETRPHFFSSVTASPQYAATGHISGMKTVFSWSRSMGNTVARMLLMTQLGNSGRVIWLCKGLACLPPCQTLISLLAVA